MLSKRIFLTSRPILGTSTNVFKRLASSAVESKTAHDRAFAMPSDYKQAKVDEYNHHQTLADIDADPESKNSLFKKDQVVLSQHFEHPTFTSEQMKEVSVAHHQPQCTSDKVARNLMVFVRKSFDWVTGYKHPPPGQENNPKYDMTEAQWLRRIVFLESIAGVPGMVGGMVRHLHSIRLLRRDRAWIETLLEEAYNERMHLLTFIQLTKPSWLMRLMILGGQGVFFNSFFITYLMFPRVCHRFVGYLEEEAISTYSRCINDLEAGKLPDFANRPAPDIAVKYWKMRPDSTVKDVMYYVRADESKHREVNHTLGNMNQDNDPNPYAIDYSQFPANEPRPTKDLKFSNQHPVGWKREEIKI